MLHARVVSPQSLLLVQHGGVEDYRGTEWFIINNPKSRASVYFSGNDILRVIHGVIGVRVGELKSPEYADQISLARSFFLPNSIPWGALGCVLAALEDDALRKISCKLWHSGLVV